jgi:hypothetical protein
VLCFLQRDEVAHLAERDGRNGHNHAAFHRFFQSKSNEFLSFSYVAAVLIVDHQKIGEMERGHARTVSEDAFELVVVPSSVHGPNASSARVRRIGTCRQPMRRTRSLFIFVHDGLSAFLRYRLML